MKKIKIHNLWFCILYVSTSATSATAQLGGPPSSPQSPKAQQVRLSGRQQNGSVTMTETPAPGSAASVNTSNASIQIDGAYQGSTAVGTVSPQVLPLSLSDAIQRGLKYNLGPIGAGEAARQARALRLAAVAQLLPDVTGSVRETVQQINLVAEGLRISAPIPGFRFPTILGPFNNFDARATFNENLSVTALRNWRSSQENVHSAELSFQDSRELVALAVAGSYLQLIAAAARIQTAQAQIETARTVYQQAVDRNTSGLNARIDVSRSQVELQTQQQRLTSLTNDFEKQKISLARLIGLPMAQRYNLSDIIPYHDAPPADVDDLIQHALTSRPDVQAASVQVKAAELVRKAASAEYYPSLDVSADYGATGVTPTNQAHGTFSVAGGVQFPIFRSGRIRADIEQADAALSQRKAEYEDIKGRAEQDVRTALLDSGAAAQQVKVADSNRTLAADTLTQARDRFRSGVSDTVELVQAQESVATAEQDYISALYAFNLAQVSVARAIGQTERGITRLLQGR
jgi:outer membrane protein TolC